MNAETIRRLNALNRAFYSLTVTDFDESRGRPWNGWRHLLPHLAGAEDAPLHVLDIGCGNGRFGRFLSRHLARPIRYHGIDHTPALLEAARDAFARMHILPDAVLETRDVIETPPETGAYDLVVLFGVLHHVPGANTREILLRHLAARLSPGGLLVFTAWRFAEYERFRARLRPLPDDMPGEAGDYLMDWRRGHAPDSALRYCHHIDEAEQNALVACLTDHGLTRIDSFRADGHTDDINAYSLLRCQNPGPPIRRGDFGRDRV